MIAGAAPAAIYTGRVRHRRHHPAAHRFSYPLGMVLLDIDRVREAMAGSRLTSYNRWNFASFDERDHLGSPQRPLRSRVMDDARAAGVTLGNGPILLLTHLRYFGYCFNPVSFFYCFDHHDRLTHVMAEVHNTYGGAGTYWLTVPPGETAVGTSTTLRASATKSLYVSPFMPDALDYAFALTTPDRQLVVHMVVREPGQAAPLFDATLSLARQPWCRAGVRRLLWRYPLMTVQVMAAIHWQALHLWRKGLPVFPRTVTPR